MPSYRCPWILPQRSEGYDFDSIAFNFLTEDRPVSISPLRVETEEEKQLFALGEKNYNAKKALAKINLRKQTPNDLESDLIHEMWLKQLEYHG